MIPARSFVLLAAAPLLLAVLTLFDESLLWPMIAADLGIVLIAGCDALLAWRPLVTVRRSARNVFSIGRSNPVTVTLRSRSRRRLAVQLRDDLFEGAEGEGLPVEVVLPARGRIAARYQVRPGRRGAYELGNHYVRYPSPLGLWIRQLCLRAADAIKVFPDVQAVRTYELLAKRDREHAVLGTARRRGGEIEFERLREYRPEDEYRAIDWKATARRREIIAREYQLETNQNLMFVLDGGRLMTAETGGLSLFDHALNATLMLSHVAARNGDRVGLFAFADEAKSYAAPAAGKLATRRIIHAAYHLHPELVESRYEVATEHLGARVRQRTLVVLFTQVVDEVAAGELLRLTRGVSRRHLPLVVLFRDVDVDAVLDPSRPLGGRSPALDAYERAAAAEVITWRDRIARDLKKQGAMILDVRPAALTPALINRYLEIKARHLL